MKEAPPRGLIAGVLVSITRNEEERARGPRGLHVGRESAQHMAQTGTRHKEKGTCFMASMFYAVTVLGFLRDVHFFGTYLHVGFKYTGFALVVTYGHTLMRIPHPVRSAKSSICRLSQ